MGCECGDVNCSCETSCRCAVERCSCGLCCNIRDHGCHIIAAMIPSYASNSPTHQEPEVKDEAPVRKEKCSLEEFSNEGKKKLEEDYTPILPVKTNLSFSSDATIIATDIIENPEVPIQEVTDNTPTSDTKEIQAQKPKASEAFLDTPAVKPSGLNVKRAKTTDEELIDHARPQHNSLICQEETDCDDKSFKRKESTPSRAGLKIYLGSPRTSSVQLIQFQQFLNQRSLRVASPTVWRASIQNWVDASDPGAGSGEEQNIEGRLTGAKKASSKYCIRKRSLSEKELTTPAKSDSMTGALNLHESSSPVKKIKNRRESCIFMTRETDGLPVADEIVPKETSRIASPTMDLKQESSATNYESEGKQRINQSGELEHDV